MASISLWLDSYDDIYSDFDYRKYHKRRLSDDFIDEIRAFQKYKTEPIENIILILPQEQRNTEIENDIIGSLRSQFTLRYGVFQKKEQKIFRKGVILSLCGALGFALDSIITLKGYHSYQVLVLRVLMEPASWFLVWNGLDSLFTNYREAKKETNFYKMLCELEIEFGNN